MIDPVIFFGATGTISGGLLAGAAMHVARARARGVSELGFIRQAKTAFFLFQLLSIGIIWLSGKVVSLDGELSRREASGFYLLGIGFMLAGLFIMFVMVLVENAARRRATRAVLLGRAQVPEAYREPRASAVRPQLPKTLRPSVRSLIRPAIGAIILIVWGLYLRGRDPIEGWIGIGFGVFLLLSSIAAGLSGKVFLRIDRDHFTTSSLFASQTHSFRDIARFEVYSASQGRKVGWNYRPGAAPSRMRKLNAQTLGVDAAFGSNYGLSPDKLCELLNDVLAFYQRDFAKRVDRA